MLSRYRKHKFTTMSELHDDISNAQCNIERKTMNKSQKEIINTLATNGISRFPDFCTPLKAYGMSHIDISNLLIYLKYKLNLPYRDRSTKKSNSSEKNMVFACICIEHSLKLIDYLEEFLSTITINAKIDFNDVRKEISNKISEVKSQINNSSIENPQIKTFEKEESSPIQQLLVVDEDMKCDPDFCFSDSFSFEDERNIEDNDFLGTDSFFY